MDTAVTNDGRLVRLARVVELAAAWPDVAESFVAFTGGGS
jgi:hypothetical protein